MDKSAISYLENLFRMQDPIVTWAITLLRSFEAAGGEQPVIVDKEWFEILRGHLDKIQQDAAMPLVQNKEDDCDGSN